MKHLHTKHTKSNLHQDVHHAKHLVHHLKTGHAAGTVTKEIVKSSMATATVRSGGKLMNTARKHPLIIFSLGVVAGYFIYKHRKEIIRKTSNVVDSSKDFVLHQKENLEDIVAEAKEEEE